MEVVLDTNVLVSAMLTPGGACARIVALVRDGTILPLFDDRIVAEYREVLKEGVPEDERLVLCDECGQESMFFVEPLTGRLGRGCVLGLLAGAEAGAADGRVREGEAMVTPVVPAREATGGVGPTT